MRRGLLSSAPEALKDAVDCLEPVTSPLGCAVDMKKAAERGLGFDELDACGHFMIRISAAEDAKLRRMFTMLLGPEWESRFTVEPDCRTFAAKLASCMALAMMTAGGRKLGIVGAMSST